MRRNAPVALVFAALAATAAGPGPDLVAEARALAVRFQQSLQTELSAAMKDGGPVAAIAVCRTKAPLLASELSTGSGWSVRRTALKVRNPGNAPDAWETATLEEFAARLAKGADPASLERSEVVEIGGKKTFRFMKAIRTAEPCLGCHGTSLKPDVAAKIRELYPDDRATGFSAGELRGAFSFSRPL